MLFGEYTRKGISDLKILLRTSQVLNIAQILLNLSGLGALVLVRVFFRTLSNYYVSSRITQEGKRATLIYWDSLNTFNFERYIKLHTSLVILKTSTFFNSFYSLKLHCQKLQISSLNSPNSHVHFKPRACKISNTK